MPTPVFDLAALRGSVTAQNLADLLGTSKQNLIFHLYAKKAPTYSYFDLPKASGGFRRISVPPFTIKAWQYSLLPALNEAYKRKRAVHGFVEDFNIVSNAGEHLGREWVLNLDVRDFFPSIHFGRLRGLFLKPPFELSNVVASMLAQLCSNKGILPQGAPTSPVLSNLICRRLDNDLLSLARRSDSEYTRFADDLTFSTNESTFSADLVQSVGRGGTVVLGQALMRLLAKNKFTPNAAKTRIQARTQRQLVTGLVVNERVNVEREYVRNLRALLRNWKVSGLAATQNEFWARDSVTSPRRYDPPSLACHVRGKLEYLHMVRGEGDEVHARYAIQASKLPGYFPRSAVLERKSARVLRFLREAVWVVVGYDASGAVMDNGTAFALEGVGLVSARHVVDDVPLAPLVWKLVRACPPYDDFPITAYRQHPAFDLTILDVSTRSHAMLRRAEESPENGASVSVAGFPNWHTYADEMRRADAVIVQHKKWKAESLASVSCPLLSGMSGGPVLDEDGHVCGVIVRNSEDKTMPNSFVSVEHINAVMSAAKKTL